MRPLTITIETCWFTIVQEGLEMESMSHRSRCDPMTKRQAIEMLGELDSLGDPEVAHDKADGILLDLIDDDDVRLAYDAVEKW